MTDQNQTAVETPAVENDGPQEVRTRKGKKGPGTLIVVVEDKAQAETVKATIAAEITDPETMVFTTDHKAVEIVSAETFLAARAEKVEKGKQRRELLDSLSDEQLALLGLSK